MCRSIKTLHNVEPAATDEEVRAAALQFVRKISGTRRPSKANQEAFERAVDQVADAACGLLSSLVRRPVAKPRLAPDRDTPGHRPLPERHPGHAGS